MFSASDVKNLREKTGAGMLDCKKALDECQGDIDKAIDWLREKGIAKAAKKQGRIAAEGLTTVKVCQGCGKAVILEINCETDFVAGSDAFKDLVQACADKVLEEKPANLDAAIELTRGLFEEAGLKLGEKLSFRRFEIVDPEGHPMDSYKHMGGKISVLTVLEHEDPEIAHGISMTVAASTPAYATLTDIPQEVLDAERKVQVELAKQDEKLAGKPAAALEKILDGKVNKALSAQVLEKQDYVLDPSKTIEQLLKERNNKVIKFVCYKVGEGLEKRKDDFAAEVAAQANR